MQFLEIFYLEKYFASSCGCYWERWYL